MEIQGTVGPQVLADGAVRNIRQGKAGESIIQDAHARLYEAVSRGAVWTAANAVAGVAHGTAFGTAPPFSIYNPPLSGKNIVLWQISMGYVSGTVGAGSVLIGSAAQTTTPTGGSVLTPKNNLIGSAAASATVCNSGSTLALTPTIVRPAFMLFPVLATTAIPYPLPKEMLDGEIMVAPGQVLVLQGVGTGGTTPLMIFSATWEETPI